MHTTYFFVMISVLFLSQFILHMFNMYSLSAYAFSFIDAHTHSFYMYAANHSDFPLLFGLYLLIKQSFIH